MQVVEELANVCDNVGSSHMSERTLVILNSW
jgi:hypothetical protein